MIKPRAKRAGLIPSIVNQKEPESIHVSKSKEFEEATKLSQTSLASDIAKPNQIAMAFETVSLMTRQKISTTEQTAIARRDRPKLPNKGSPERRRPITLASVDYSERNRPKIADTATKKI